MTKNTNNFNPNIRIVLIICVLLMQSYSKYTNKQATECFTTKATQSCAQVIQQCTDDQDCRKQLYKFQSCSFGTKQNDIFNGYCFRKWREESSLTKQMISCMIDACNLQYNSKIGVNQLFQCSQSVIIENYQECDQQCIKEFNKVRELFNSLQITDVFMIQLENQVAAKLFRLIKANCIDKQYIPEKRRESNVQNLQAAVDLNELSKQNAQPEITLKNVQVPNDKQVQNSGPAGQQL